jgi:hypothetical protein
MLTLCIRYTLDSTRSEALEAFTLLSASSSSRLPGSTFGNPRRSP